MTKIKVKKDEDTKATFKDRISDIVEEMWEKIGQHHHGFYARAGSLSKPDTDLSATEDVLTYRVELPGVDDEIVTEAKRGDICSVKLSEKVRPSDKLYKVVDAV